MEIEFDTCGKTGDVTVYMGSLETVIPCDEVTEWCKDAVLTTDEEGAVWDNLDADALTDCVQQHGQ